MPLLTDGDDASKAEVGRRKEEAQGLQRKTGGKVVLLWSSAEITSRTGVCMSQAEGGVRGEGCAWFQRDSSAGLKLVRRAGLRSPARSWCVRRPSESQERGTEEASVARHTCVSSLDQSDVETGQNRKEGKCVRKD